jgi:hypothetical protein
MKTTLLKKTLTLILTLGFSATAMGAGTSSMTGLSGSLETSRNVHFYRDPSRAFLLGLFPGLLIHGYGHFYAKDKMTGVALLGGEVLSLTVIGIGLAAKNNPSGMSGGVFGSNNATITNTGQRMIIFGCIGFGVTWLADMLHAPIAAKNYNDQWNLQPVASVDNGVASLALAYRF